MILLTFGLLPPSAVWSPSNVAADIVAGSSHNCALVDGGGAVACWGLNTNGQLGIGSTSYVGITRQQMAENVQRVNLGTGALRRLRRRVCAAVSGM